MEARNRRRNPHRKGAMGLAVSWLLAGCAVSTGLGPRPPTLHSNPLDVQAFAGWSPSALRRRAAHLEGRILRRAPGSPSLAAHRHRLATVYVVLSLHEKRRAMLQRERQLTLKWWQNVRRHQLRRAHRYHRARSKQYHWLAVRQWLEVVHSVNSHRYGRLDELLWRAASALLAASKAETRTGWPAQIRRRRRQGYGLLERLVRHHPTSRYVGRALLGLGAALRLQGHPEAAALTFRKVLKGPWTASFARAHLGLGRCLTAVNRPRAALRHLARAHRLAGGTDDRSAIRDALFGAWVVAGKAAEAHAFMRRVTGGGAPARRLFLALAAWCGRSGRPTLALELWQRARRRWPRDQRRCVWWDQAVSGAARQHRWHTTERLLGAAPALLAGLSRQLGAWARPVRQCRTQMETTLKRIATQLHARGLRHKQLAELNVSRRAYALYGSLFPRTPNTFLMQSQHADLLWSMVTANLRSSGPTVLQMARVFDRLARRSRPRTLDEKQFRRLRLDWALTAVRAWLRAAHLRGHQTMDLKHGLAGPRPCLKRRARRCLRRGPPSLRRRALSASHRGLRRAALYYLRVCGPKARYRSQVRFLLGTLHWRHNQLPEALPHLLAVAFKHPVESPVAARAAAFRAYHVLGALGKTRAAAALLRRSLANKHLMADDDFRDQLRGIWRQTQWTRARALVRQKRWWQCGALFERIARPYPGPRSQEAWRQSAHCYEVAGHVGGALRALRWLLLRFPQSRRAPTTTLRVARLYQQLTSFDLAAQWYERYVNNYPERADAPAAHLKALRLRLGLGRRHTLATQLRSFLGRYGTTHPRLAARARWLWIRFERARGQTGALPGLLRAWLKRHARHAAPDRVLEARLLLATLAWRRSCRVAPTRGRCLSAPVRGPQGARPRRPLLRRAPQLVRLTHRLLSRVRKAGARRRGAMGVPAGVPDRQARLHRARLNVRQVASLLTAVRRYRTCIRAPRCRSGRAAPRRVVPKSPRPPVERYRKVTPPTFRARPATFDGRPLRTRKPRPG